MEQPVDRHVYTSGELSDSEIEALYSGFLDQAIATLHADPTYLADIAAGSGRGMRRRRT